MKTSLTPMGGLEWSLLLLLSLLWGGSFFFAKIAVGEIPPLTLVLARVSIAALALWLVLFLGGYHVPRGWAGWHPLLVMGILNNAVPFTLLFWGMTEVASGLAAILNATTPLFTVLLAHLFTEDERLTGGKLAGVLFGLCGVVVLVGVDVLQGLGAAVLAQLACLGAAISYAFSGIWGRRLSTNPPVVNAAGQLTMSSLILLPLVLAVDRPWTMPVPSPDAILAVLGLALVSTALGYLIFFRILRTSGATNLLLVTLLIPASALVLGAGLLDERIEANALLGMVLIGLGLAAIDGRPAAMIGRRCRAAGLSRR